MGQNEVMRTSEISNRLRGGLYGLLVGDALGVPYEFHSANELPDIGQLEMEPPSRFMRAHRRVPSGTWSDDGAQALVLLDGLLRVPALDLGDFGQGLLGWCRRGTMTPDGVVFDIGIQTRHALQRLERGVPPQLSGLADEQSNGNGSLMRTLPCALVPVVDQAALVDRARRQSLVTHGHARSQLACAFSALIAWELLRGSTFVKALDVAQNFLEQGVVPAERSELAVLLDGRLDEPRGSGYVVDTFWSAVASVLRTDSYEGCVKLALSIGNDTDTTACIAGGWAGLLYGEAAIPHRWMGLLRGKELVEPLLARLVSSWPTAVP